MPRNYLDSIDDEQFVEDQQAAAQSGGAFRDWVSGANVLRILPPVANTGFARGRVLLPIWTYWRLPPDEAMARDIRRTFGDKEDDPIHDALAELRKQGVDTSKLEAKSRPSFYANVVDLRADEPQVQVQKFPKGLANWVFEQLNDEALAGRAVLNPYAGTALSVKYDPDHKDAKQIYVPSWHPTASNKPICKGGDEAVDALMDTCVDLAEVFTPPEGEDLEKIVEVAKALFEYAAPADPPVVTGPADERDDLPF